MPAIIPSNIKGIIFDLDGTLYHMKWFMKPYLTMRLLPHITHLPKYMSIRKEFMGKDMDNGPTLLRAMAKKLSQKAGTYSPEIYYTWIQNKFYPAFEDSMTLLRGSRPGVTDCLRILKNKKYKLGVLSDFAHVEERLLNLHIPPDIFDTILSSETEGALKPHTRPFTTMINRWEIPPCDILLIGDRADTDGAVAEKLGLQFIQISDRVQKSGNTCNWATIKNSLNQLPLIK